jgi:hypothetical protein
MTDDKGEDKERVIVAPEEEVRVTDAGDFFSAFAKMHQVCDGPDWRYKEDTYISHKVFTWKSPVEGLLKKFKI